MKSKAKIATRVVARTLLVLASLGANPLEPAAVAQDAVDPSQVSELVRQLAAGDAATRQRASDRLVSAWDDDAIRRDLLDRVERARRAGDPNEAMRVQVVLDRIEVRRRLGLELVEVFGIRRDDIPFLRSLEEYRIDPDASSLAEIGRIRAELSRYLETFSIRTAKRLRHQGAYVTDYFRFHYAAAARVTGRVVKPRDELRAGDTIELGEGTFQLGAVLLGLPGSAPDDLRIQGAGAGRTKLRTGGRILFRAAREREHPPRRIEFAGLTIDCEGEPLVDHRGPEPLAVRIRDCRVEGYGNGDAVFSSGGLILLIEESIFDGTTPRGQPVGAALDMRGINLLHARRTTFRNHREIVRPCFDGAFDRCEYVVDGGRGSAGILLRSQGMVYDRRSELSASARGFLHEESEARVIPYGTASSDPWVIAYVLGDRPPRDRVERLIEDLGKGDLRAYHELEELGGLVWPELDRLQRTGDPRPRELAASLLAKLDVDREYFERLVREDLRRNPSYLITLLRHEEPRIRGSAWKRWCEIVGADLDFDPALAGLEGEAQVRPIIEWYEAHRSRLRWDEAAGRYRW